MRKKLSHILSTLLTRTQQTRNKIDHQTHTTKLPRRGIGTENTCHLFYQGKK